MMHHTPAILGGTPTFTRPFAPYRTIGAEERDAVVRVIEDGRLSGFIGAWVPQFYGGERVRELEANFCARFGVKHAIAVNSATSGLYAAIGALGIEPGDEVIVTPMTMTATVTGIVLYQAIPIFVDICPETFCIDPRKVEAAITERTRAIIGVNIYGESAYWDGLRAIADRHGLKLIEDAAQSIGGRYAGRHAGTLGDIGVFSLNRHKHVHCGEGGVCVTNDDALAERIRLIRNHGEAVVGAKGTQDITNIIGFNFRMTELEAAVAIAQLTKLDAYVAARQRTCRRIIDVFARVPGIIPPVPSPLTDPASRPGLCRPASLTVEHVYYYLCFTVDAERLGMPRDAFVAALNAEGIPFGAGGYEPIYLQPMYQRKIAFGTKGYPFTSPAYGKPVSYPRGLCPIAERMWFRDLCYFQIQNVMPTDAEVDRFADALEKIFAHRTAIVDAYQARAHAA